MPPWPARVRGVSWRKKEKEKTRDEPGIESPKSLMLKARLNPEAKKPPKGATREAKAARTIECSWNGAHEIEVMCWRVYVMNPESVLCKGREEKTRTKVSRVAVTDAGRGKLLQTKTLFGWQVMSEKTFIERSWAGQIM